jgi:hypothetical protein
VKETVEFTKKTELTSPPEYCMFQKPLSSQDIEWSAKSLLFHYQATTILCLLRMTIADPIIQKFIDHLNDLYGDVYLSPDTVLLSKVEDALRYDDNVRSDSSILIATAPVILQIINSNNTTARTKKYAIQFLGILLPYFSFQQVSSIFNEDLMIEAFNGNDYLKCVLAKVLERADPEAIVHGPLLKCLFETLADSKTDVATVNAVQKAIIKLATDSDSIKEKILHDRAIGEIMESMKHDELIQSRLADLICELLPEIPQIPTSLYLVTEKELADSADILFYGFTINIWRVLLYQLHNYDNLSFLKEAMKPQLDFCCRRLVGERTLLDDIETFSNCNDYGLEFLVVTISFVSLETFQAFDKKYNIVDYCMSNYQTKRQCNRFLGGVNTVLLRDNSLKIYQDFKLSHEHVELFCHLASDPVILKKNMILERFPQTLFTRLVFEDIFQIFVTLCNNPAAIEKMVSDWPFIITKVISADIVNDTVIQSYNLEEGLHKLIKSGVELGNLYTPVTERYQNLKNTLTASVHDPLTETL